MRAVNHQQFSVICWWEDLVAVIKNMPRYSWFSSNNRVTPSICCSVCSWRHIDGFSLLRLAMFVLPGIEVWWTCEQRLDIWQIIHFRVVKPLLVNVHLTVSYSQLLSSILFHFLFVLVEDWGLELLESWHLRPLNFYLLSLRTNTSSSCIETICPETHDTADISSYEL